MKTNKSSIFVERYLLATCARLIKRLDNKELELYLPDNNHDKIQKIPAIT